jgi:hypothetical protein
MYEHKVIITKDESVINEMLAAGWFVVSVTAQHVAVSTASSLTSSIKGEFCFVLKK